MYLKHFYDSLTLNKIINLEKTNNMCDIGSGAGFPGVVIKIFFPNLIVTLVDSIEKRTKFLNLVIKEIDLKDIIVVKQRAEIFGNINREKYEVVTARAVAKLNILAELCLPITKIDGYFIAMKANCDEEIELSKEAVEKLGGKIIKAEKFLLPFENSTRTLIKIVKNRKTLTIYPRKFEKIKEKPL